MVIYASRGIIIRGDEVLLIKRRSLSFNNYWSNPGGKVNERENLEDTVRRELREELAIEVEICRKLSDYFDFQRGGLVGIYSGYEVKIIAGIPRINEPNKIRDLRYFPINHFPQKIAPYTLQYLDDLKRIG